MLILIRHLARKNKDPCPDIMTDKTKMSKHSLHLVVNIYLMYNCYFRLCTTVYNILQTFVAA